MNERFNSNTHLLRILFILICIGFSVSIASGFYNIYSTAIRLTPYIQYVLGSDIGITDGNDGDNGSPRDNNGSSPRDESKDEEGEDGEGDTGGTLVAREREDDEDDEDQAEVDERDELPRPEGFPSDGNDISLDTEETDDEEVAQAASIA